MNMKVVFWFLALLFTSSAQATLVQQSSSFSVANALTGFSLFTFDPFDTALGSLNRVTFNIEGMVILNAIATPNLIPQGLAGPQPVPYDYTLRMDMDVFRLAGFDFDFTSDAQFYFSGTDPGAGANIVQTQQFSLTAEFDEFTDIFGFDIPTTSNNYIPPLSIASSRSDFEENLITSSLGLQFQMLNIWHINSIAAVSAQIIPMGSSAGLVTLSYDYTPIPEVPVPAAIWLFGTGLVGLVGFSKRRKVA